MSEYRRRTQEVRQPGGRNSPLSRSNSNPLSPATPRSPQSPPPLPGDAMVISPPPPPSHSSPAEIDLLAAPPPLFLSGASTSAPTVPHQAAVPAQPATVTSSKPSREAPIYEPVSPDMDVESPPGMLFHLQSGHCMNPLFVSGQVQYNPDRFPTDTWNQACLTQQVGLY